MKIDEAIKVIAKELYAENNNLEEMNEKFNIIRKLNNIITSSRYYIDSDLMELWFDKWKKHDNSASFKIENTGIWERKSIYINRKLNDSDFKFLKDNFGDYLIIQDQKLTYDYWDTSLIIGYDKFINAYKSEYTNPFEMWNFTNKCFMGSYYPNRNIEVNFLE